MYLFWECIFWVKATVTDIYFDGKLATGKLVIFSAIWTWGTHIKGIFGLVQTVALTSCKPSYSEKNELNFPTRMSMYIFAHGGPSNAKCENCLQFGLRDLSAHTKVDYMYLLAFDSWHICLGIFAIFSERVNVLEEHVGGKIATTCCHFNSSLLHWNDQLQIVILEFTMKTILD